MLTPERVSLKGSFGLGKESLTHRQEGKILVVDDEASVRRALHSTLFSLGFDIGEASSGEEAIAICRIVRYDGVLLDINMPGKGGIETCRELGRLVPGMAILMLSVNDDQERKIEALEAGADDYVTKPFHVGELTARIRAALRRSRASAAPTEEVITVGEIEIHPARRLVQKSGHAVHLTPKEFDLLYYLIAHAGLPITHARLLHVVWGAEYANQVEYLRTFVRQLRRKLEDDAGQPKYLLTDTHVGYRFVDPAHAPSPDKSPAAPESNGAKQTATAAGFRRKHGSDNSAQPPVTGSRPAEPG
jgi:two-component system KDP operon response regulator KdpE